MNSKKYQVLKKIYASTMMISFWGGVFPLIPYIIAIIIGEEIGEKIALFLYNQYYPWIIALASIAVVIGLVAMYVGKQEALSTRSFNENRK